MLRSTLIFILALFCTPVSATPRDDAAFFLTHFVHNNTWNHAFNVFRGHGAWFYKAPLLERGITIADHARFSRLMPDETAIHAVRVLQTHVADQVVEAYGAEHISDIASFFRTDTGARMLFIAKEQNLFRHLHSQSPHNGPIERWRTFLSPLELARFNTFAATPAGQAFVQQTWAVRRSIFYTVSMRSRWPDIPLDRAYMLDVLATDGVLRFPNPVARAALMSELNANQP